MYIRHILLANWSKTCKGCRLICVCFVKGVEMNLSPSASKLIWSFVSSLFERFFMFFLLVFSVIFARFCKHHTTFFYFRYELCTSQFSSSSPAGLGMILYHHQVLSIDPAGPCWADIISSSGLINWSSGTMRSTIDSLSLNLAKLLIPLRNPPSFVGWLLILCSFWLFLAVHYLL